MSLPVPPFEGRLLVLLRPCKACGEKLYFVRLASGKQAPYTADGLNHFINCPKAAEFRKAKL